MRLLEEGYRKVAQDNGSLIRAILFNPHTETEVSILLDDLEYAYEDALFTEYSSAERAVLQQLPIDSDTKTAWETWFAKKERIPYVGATIEITKGRKYPKGTKGVVISLYPFHDSYGRFVCTYLITDNGMKVSAQNVKVLA